MSFACSATDERRLGGFERKPAHRYHQIERLELVKAVLGEVVIPPAVAAEIAPSVGDPPNWVQVRTCSLTRAPSPWRSGLDRGEIEAIALAIELSAGQVLLDDRPARRAAKRLGLFVVGSVGLLLESYRLGFVDSIHPDLDAMIDVGFFIEEPLYEEILGLAREIAQERR